MRKNSCPTCIATSVTTIVLLLATGCQRPAELERVAVVPVEGTVVFDGRPTPGALVVFHPIAEAEPAVPPPRATVEEDGSFHLTTYDARDGAPPGQYKVTVEWRKLVGEGSDVQAGPNLLPGRYSRPDTTELQMSIAEGVTQLPRLEIKR